MAKVLMAGGLGNQLFQFSAGRLLSEDLELVYGIFPVRALESGGDLFENMNNFNLKVSQQEVKRIILRKLLGYSLRRSAIVTPKAVEKVALEILLSITTWITEGRRTKYFINNGLGWDQRLLSVSKSATLIGYFQSHQVALAGESEIKEILRSVVLPAKFAGDNSTTLVHVRLTDYSGSNSLGHLSNEYYKNGLAEISQNRLSNYSIFTDGTSSEISSKYEILDVTKIVETSGLNSWQVLKLMSRYKNFLLANSSFSWWGATLRDEKMGKVIAPRIWFLNGTPDGIYQPDWICI